MCTAQPTNYLTFNMVYDQEEQYRRADIIVDAVCQAGECSYCDFIFKKRSLRMNILRGVAFYLSWEYGVHARRMALVARRSRSNVINQSKRYRYYVRNGDALSVVVYKKAKSIIETKL